MSAEVLQDDCRDVLDLFPDDYFDSCVTDPPYGLTSARPGGRSEATRGAVMKGFMGLAWDGDVPSVDVWREVLRVLKPGAYALVFGGARTYHRVAVNIEDAGFEIRDQIQWLYGSGFPKSKNIGGGRGTALKPAHEPIVLARKPLVGSVAANSAEFGTGTLNIDACRTEEGRWPANVIHDGSEEVISAFPDAPGQLADASTSSSSRKTQNVYGAMARGSKAGPARGDTGSAARFFYCAKANRADREDGCESLPLREGGIRSETSGQHITRRDGGDPGLVHNNHPTVKPTQLMRYLCRLVTPTGGTVLDPFCGSGSTGRGALLEGFNFTGIEREADYVAIAKARIEAARRK